jgi:hypothetical protein
MPITLLLGSLLLLITVLVHVSTFFTDREPQPTAVTIPLTGLMFVLFFKAMMVARKNQLSSPEGWSWKQALRYAPRWLPVLLVLLAAYTGFNFFYSLMVLNEGLTPDSVQGQFVLQDHDRVVRTLSQEEYWRHSAYQLRGMSTHIILFTAIAMGMLWSHTRKEKYSG